MAKHESRPASLAKPKARRTRGRANRAPLQPGELSCHPFARVNGPSSSASSSAARSMYRLGARRPAGAR